MKQTITILCSLFLVVTISFAETSFYNSGSLSFEYQQFPVGPFSGIYQIEGEIDTNYVWPDTLEGVGAFVITDYDSTEIYLFAPRVNPDTTMDVFAFRISTEGDFVPGTYPVSLDMSTMFAFVWKADSLIIPDNPDSMNIIDIISSIQAEYIFISTSGSIVVTEVTDSSFSGTFSGFAIDTNTQTMILISDGIYSVSLNSGYVNVDNNNPLISEIDIKNFPNPFSTSTTISFNLAIPITIGKQTRIQIYNIKGQLVKQLSINNRQSSIIWDGKDENGRQLSNGIYFYQLSSGNVESEIRKMILLR